MYIHISYLSRNISKLSLGWRLKHDDPEAKMQFETPPGHANTRARDGPSEREASTWQLAWQIPSVPSFMDAYLEVERYGEGMSILKPSTPTESA